LQVDSPWLLLLLFPVAAAAFFASRGRAVRTLLFLAGLSLTLAAAGVSVGQRRAVRWVALVDVSPSTRSAGFRDETFVRNRIAELFPGSAVEVRYFADGETTSAEEVAVERTRLPVADADGVALFSDGRFAPTEDSPPIYPVIDPALERTDDARIATVRPGALRAAIDVAGNPQGRTLFIDGDNPQAIALSAESRTMSVIAGGPRVAARLSGGDPWPENDALTARRAPAQDEPAWSVGTTIAGMTTVSPSAMPTDLADYLAPPAIVVRDAAAMSSASRRVLVQYAEVLGGTLVLLDAPAALPPDLRRASPLSAVPPRPEATWTILIDASGSMSTTDRWTRALDAAAGAVSMLAPQERIELATFAGDVRVIGSDLTPSDAGKGIDTLRRHAPSGPTGLRAAISRLGGTRAGSPRKLLILSDADGSLEPVVPLADQLRSAATVPLFVLTSAGDPSVHALADRAGGSVTTSADPTAWAAAAVGTVAAARGGRMAGAMAASGENELAGLRFDVDGLWPSYLVEGSAPLASSGDNVIAARRPVGLGLVAATAAEVPAGALPEIVARLRRTPADPRLSVSIDAGVVRVLAWDNDRPMNGLRLSCRGDSPAPLALEQVGPGVYAAPAPPAMGVVTVTAGDSVVARLGVTARYPPEFDAIGNDRPALAALAASTGGRVIEPGERQPIELPRPKQVVRADGFLAALGFALAGAALAAIRVPYLTVRFISWWKRARPRSVAR
jgi:hypothetical protein